MAPLVSVVIPVYNTAGFIYDAVKSVCDQTYSNLQILIMDDASGDDSVTVIRKIIDDRIEVYESPVNRGQAYQMNLGIQRSKGEYVCIMHADDIMNPEKIERQLSFFLSDSLLGVCGCNIKVFGQQAAVWKYPNSDQECKDTLLASVPFAHPAVIIRKEVLNSVHPVYNEDMAAAEDYDLWVRLADKTKFANVQEVLLNYRIHDSQLSHTAKEKEIKLVEETRRKIISQLFKVGEQNVQLCFKALYYTSELTFDDAVKGVEILWKANKQKGIFSDSVLKGRLRHQLLKTLSKAGFLKRLAVLKSNSIMEICFLKTLLRIIINPSVDKSYSG